jgi:hypothetical protein
MKKTMRQTTLFSIVSSNWGDSFGSEHFPSDKALAATMSGSEAFCSHSSRSTFTARRSVNCTVSGWVQTQGRGYTELPSA